MVVTAPAATVGAVRRTPTNPMDMANVRARMALSCTGRGWVRSLPPYLGAAAADMVRTIDLP
jgi:hypothetical protein